MRGFVAVNFRDLDVDVEYEIDGEEVNWWFTDPDLNQEKLTDVEQERIADRCWEDQWI